MENTPSIMEAPCLFFCIIDLKIQAKMQKKAEIGLFSLLYSLCIFSRFKPQNSCKKKDKNAKKNCSNCKNEYAKKSPKYYFKKTDKKSRKMKKGVYNTNVTNFKISERTGSYSEYWDELS